MPHQKHKGDASPKTQRGCLTKNTKGMPHQKHKGDASPKNTKGMPHQKHKGDASPKHKGDASPKNAVVVNVPYYYGCEIDDRILIPSRRSVLHMSL